MGGNILQQTTLDAGFQTTPDLATLQSMQDPIVMVTKVIDSTGGKRKDQLVINGLTGLKIADILQLQDDLPTPKYPKGGPGTYRFEVTDQASTAKAVWQIRLGGPGDDSGAPTISRPGGVVSSSPVQRGPAVVSAGLPVAPISSDVENLGNGFVYHKVFKLLTVPDGRVFQWEPGKPLPDLGFTQSAVATPLGAPLFANQGQAAPAPEVTALQAEIARLREDARERDRQAELATMRKAHEEQMSTMQSRFEQLVEKLTAKPVESVELIELRRQNERLQERERENTLRTEMASKIDAVTALVREVQSNRGTDPMVTVLTGMLNQQTESARENLRVMRDFSAAQLTAAQASALTPEKALDIFKQQAELVQNSGSSMFNEKTMGVMNMLFDSVIRLRQAESQLSGNNGTDWMAVFQTLADKGGTALNAIAQAQSKKAAAETAKANATAVQARAQAIADARAAAELRVAHAAEVAATPALPPSPPEGEAARDALAAAMFPKPVSTSSVATPTPVAPAPPALVSVPSPEPARRKSGKRENPLMKATLPELRSAFGSTGDAIFFGPFMESIDDLRAEMAKDPEQYSPDDVAQFVIEAREFIAQAVQEAGGKAPLVVDMLAHGRFDYLFERMLPKAGHDFWNAAATALQAKLAAEKATTE